METGKHFVSYIALAALILIYEYSDARPTDSLYGDYLYSGAIYPISGAVPKKIHSHDKKSKNDTSTAGNANPTMDSLYGNTQTKMDSIKGSANSTMDSLYGNANPTMDSLYGSANSTMDSLYGDHVYSGAIHPISGAIPKKIPRKNKRNTQSMMGKMKGNTQATMDSMKGNTQPMMDSMKGTTPYTMDSMKGNTLSTMDSIKGSAHSTMDSLYDHVYSGAIHPISGAIPKKIPRKNKTKDERKAQTKEERKVQKAKKIFDKLGIDLSQIDLSQIDATHKFDGKDSLQPALCDDTYNDRYGVAKHFVRGARDVAFALVSGVEGLVDDLLTDISFVPTVTSGIGGGLKAIICAIENGFSDIAGDLDSGLDIAKNGLVDFFKLKGPHPILDIPVGIAGIAGETVKGAGQLVGDAVGGVKNAVGV